MNGIYFANTNIIATYFETDTMFSLGSSLLRLLLEKMKSTQTLLFFKSKVNLDTWLVPLITIPADSVKFLSKILVLMKIVQV